MRRGRILVWLAFSITVIMPLFMLNLSLCEAGYERYAGRHPLEILHEDTCVREKFRSILGDNYQTFLQNLEVSHQTVLMNGWLISEGIARNYKDKGKDSAIFCMDVYSGQVYAAVFSNGTIVHFYGANSLADLPEPVTQWTLHHALMADPFYSGSIWTKGRL